MDKNHPEYYDYLCKWLYSPVLADIMDGLGYRDQVMAPGLQPVYPGAVVAGRACTIRMADVESQPAHPYDLLLTLLDGLQAGEVVVCSCTGKNKSGVWGELVSTCSVARGARGAVIEGGCRDINGIVSLGFPVFATYLSPADSKGRHEAVEIHAPVTICGVMVRQGDLVFADQDGCVAVPSEIEDRVVEEAIKKVQGENIVRELLRKGESITKVFARYGIL